MAAAFGCFPLPIGRGSECTVKIGGFVANFFHSGRAAGRNNMAFLILWRRTTMKNAFGVFYSGRVVFTMIPVREARAGRRNEGVRHLQAS